MRRDHRAVATELILTEAIRHGLVAEGQISLPTLRRLFRDAGLTRLSKTRQDRSASQRRRWQTATPCDLWHADVCHVVLADGRKALVHGMIDDASRFFVALSAREAERERDMLEVFFGALLRYPPPRALFLDNGPCYSGELLALVCKRLNIRLIHAKPYDPQARGKMERVWRTMRQRCTDHLPANASLHDIRVALGGWLDADYHRRPHAALLGNTPSKRFLHGVRGLRAPLTARTLAKAMEVTETRQVRADGTFTVDRVLYEVVGAWLARKRIALVLDGLTGKPIAATYKDKSIRFGPCDPVANRSRPRPTPTPQASASGLPFDPIAGLLARARQECDDE